MNPGISLVRFLLAFNVILFHVWNQVAPGAGPVAVLAFFYISGYLITQIVRETYASAGQAGAFLLNRLLRIYPQYAAALVLGLLAVYLYPDTAYGIHEDMQLPTDAAEWIPQFAIFGLYGSEIRILPMAWSLSTELYYYLAIGLVTGRSRTLALALFAVSLPVGALCALEILPFDFYGHPIGNGFAFAFGSVTYFYRGSLSPGRWVFALACLAYALHSYAVPFLIEDGLDDANLAASLIPFSLIFVYLVRLEARDGLAAVWANAMGRMAYPMFLTHWAVNVFVSQYFFGGRANRGVQPLARGGVYFISLLAGVLVCSFVFCKLIDGPIERIRRNIRSRAKSAGDAGRPLKIAA